MARAKKLKKTDEELMGERLAWPSDPYERFQVHPDHAHKEDGFTCPYVPTIREDDKRQVNVHGYLMDKNGEVARRRLRKGDHVRMTHTGQTAVVVSTKHVRQDAAVWDSVLGTTLRRIHWLVAVRVDGELPLDELVDSSALEFIDKPEPDPS